MEKTISVKIIGADTEVLTYYQGLYMLADGAGVIKYKDGNESMRFVLTQDEVRLKKEGELSYELVFHLGLKERALIMSSAGILVTYVTAKRLQVRYDENGAHTVIDYEQDYGSGETALYSVEVNTI